MSSRATEPEIIIGVLPNISFQQSARKDFLDDRYQSRRRTNQPRALQPRRHRGQGCSENHCAGPPGRAVRHLPGNGGAVLPLFLLRAAAFRDGRGTPQVA